MSENMMASVRLKASPTATMANRINGRLRIKPNNNKEKPKLIFFLK
jgi:hypothetical protein